MDIEKIKRGVTLVLIENKVAIDKLYVLEVKEMGLFGDPEIRLKSLILKPGKCSSFSFFDKEGWVLITYDPFSDRPCRSTKGPFYNFESALHPNWVNSKIQIED